MAKSVKAAATKKTGNRRVKRTVRRTIGALCMVSAITVAAIPVPDIEAYNGSAAENIVAYGTAPATINELNLTNCDITSASTGTAYTIAQSSAGDWQLDWQFKYYAPSSGADGYVQKYNSQYQVNNVALDYRVFADYVNISTDDYSKYYNSTNVTETITPKKGSNPMTAKTVYTLGHTYTLNVTDTTKDTNTWGTAAGTPGNDLWFFSNYLPSTYETYKSAWQEAYDNEHDGDDTTPYTYPSAVTATFKDAYKTDAEQQQRLCDQIVGTGSPMSLVLVQERVYDGSGNAVSWNSLYVPKLNTVPSTGTSTTIGGESYYFNSDGFLCGSFATLIGIEPEAFKGVSNVDTLTMANEIRYIGDSAFEDSFVQSVTVSKDASIGDFAFKNCGSLTSVTIPNGVTAIGAEAFYGTTITSLDIPSTVATIGDGAFAYCRKLQSVSFDDSGSSDQVIGDWAFYDNIALSNVDFAGAQITELGYGCFAVESTETGNLTTFDMPNYITNGNPNSYVTGDGIGDYLLANRQKLTNIYMPDNLKGSGDGGADVTSTFVARCVNLECVEFPNSASTATFDDTIFRDVINQGFYVRGPKLNNTSVAKPRESTWTALFNNPATPVPYVYNENNMDFYEVCKDEDGNGTADYIMCIDQDGNLVSCTFPKGVTAHAIGTAVDTPFTIPAQVGTITVSALGENCFEDTSVTTGVKDWIEYLKIEDGSGITSLDASVFAGAARLKEVDIGDSVQTIGNSCFEGCPELLKATVGENIASLGDNVFHNCPKLTEIRFDAPASLTEFTLDDIGSQALSTGSPRLTVYGEIGTEYGPFVWSMQPDNYVDQDEGIRVCYKTNSPTNLTVINDNTTGLPTLVDYPHYDQLDDYAKAIGLDNGDASYSLEQRIKDGASLSNKEQQLYNAVVNINIPEGIRSIDVKGFINNPASSGGYSNAKNDEVYLNPATALDSNNNAAGLKHYDAYKNYGLFNGYYGDTDSSYTYDIPDKYYHDLLYDHNTVTEGTAATLKFDDKFANEDRPAGNDIVESITMNDVEYLPDLAFYHCEKLNYISLGDDITDVGELPIADCTALTSIACGNNNFISENGMLYENKSDGTKKLVECFPGQGKVVGASDVNTTYHPSLNDVSEIAEGAFSDCDMINFVDLTGVDETTVPKYCFYDCDNLRDVTLPNNFDEINENAFAEDPSVILEIANPDLVLASDAFGDFTNGQNPVLYTTEGSIVEKMSKKLGANKLPAIIHYITNAYKITYICGQDGYQVYIERDIEEGDHPDGPDPDVVAQHEASLADQHANFEFSHYADGSGTTYTNLRKLTVNGDMTLTMVYVPVSNVTPTPSTSADVTPSGAVTGGGGGGTGSTTPGTTPTGSGGGGSSSTKYPLTVVYGSGSGQYPEGTKVIIEAIDAPAGKVFDKWVVTGAAASVYSSTSKATTVTTAAGETIITATYKDEKSGSGSSSSGSGGTTGTKTSTGTHNRIGADGSPAAGTGSSTRVDITKPGISDVDKAYASVSGSTDSFVVKITESADAANAVATALAQKYGDMTPIKYFAMDISLYDATGTNKITDTTGLKVNVTMPIPDALRQYAGNNKVGAVVNGTQLEDLACKFTTVDGIPCISFTATHFSPYTIYVDTNNLQVGLMDSSPKTGDPIHPKWFVTIALAATSLFLFLKKDKVIIPAKA